MKLPQPKIQYITDRVVHLTDEFKTGFQYRDHVFIFTIPKGYETDGASIPNIFWGFPFYFVPFEGDTLPAAVVHDYFYSNKLYTKADADWCFYHLLKKYRVSIIKRSLYFIAVHFFGHYPKRKQLKKNG